MCVGDAAYTTVRLIVRKLLYFSSEESSLTGRADVVCVFIFSAEDGHLHHSQEYDPSDPELDSQEVLPVARCPDEPQQSVQDVHDAHHHVELNTDREG